jgi:hypothetical protein
MQKKNVCMGWILWLCQHDVGGEGGGGREGVLHIHILRAKVFLHSFPPPYGPNNNKDTKPLMSSLLFNRVNRLEIQSVMLEFSTPLVN